MHRCAQPARAKDGQEWTCPDCNVSYIWVLAQGIWKWVGGRG